MGGVRVGLHVRDRDTTTASVYVSVTVLYLALSSDSGIPGFGCPGVVFLLIEFPLRQQISVSFIIPLCYILLTLVHTLVVILLVWSYGTIQVSRQVLARKVLVFKWSV